jgi:hypothetical protein
MLLADGCRAIVWAIYITPALFDDRRELTIEVNGEAIVKRIQQIAKYDWKKSHKLYLTDEGLSKDLEERGNGGAEKLVLNFGKKKKRVIKQNTQLHRKQIASNWV